MASQTQTPTRRTSLAPLVILISVCVLLIVINVSAALEQSSLNSALSGRDIYTLETSAP